MGLVRMVARRLEWTPNADDLDSVISVWVDDLEAFGLGDVHAIELRQALERYGRTATRWPYVRDVIGLLPSPEPPPRRDIGWSTDLPRPPEWCTFERRRGESRTAYNRRMCAQAREVLRRGSGPLAGISGALPEPEREPGCDDDLEAA